MITFSPRQQIVPLRQGANEVFREMTKCHFVPHEGSTTQCDAGPARERSDGGGGENHSQLTTTYYLSTPSPLRGTRPCLRGRKWMLGYCKNTKSPFFQL